MRRVLYRGLLGLHPARFEERFGEEMLWIFDLKSANETGALLLADCLVSLCRQWIRCQRVWTFGIGLAMNGMLALCAAVCYWNAVAHR